MKNSRKLLIILSIIPLTSSCGGKHNSTNYVSNIISSQNSSHNDTTIEENSTSVNSTKENDTTDKETDNNSTNTTEKNNTNETTELKSQWQGLDLTTYGNTFRGELQKLINKSGNKTIGYKSNNEVLAQSDKATNGNGIVPFYHAGTESYNGNWNKEHVWPNSRGAGKTGPGADPQMLRPTISTENSSRSNYFYGNGGTDGSNTWDPGSLGYEPARGEAARIIFYCATKYFNTCGTGGSSNGSKPLELSNNPNDNKDNHTMGRLDRLIEWNNKYPVTEQEKKRNDYLYSQGFSRNPFIDHPELVNYIWDTNGIRGSSYNGNITSGGNTSTETGGESKVEYTYEYDVIEDLNYLSTYNTVSIVATDSNVTASMKDTPKNTERPWYLDSEAVTYEDSKIKTNSKLVEFEVTKNSNGSYTFKNGSKYLYHYISGTHYSIGCSETIDNNGSSNFNLTSNNGEITFKGELGVYLDFLSNYSTFSGSKSSNSKIKLVYISK